MTGNAVRIATFIANGIRARMPILLGWLQKESPDVLCVQETKVQDPDFPCKSLADAGYESVFKGQKSYNGVAVLTRGKPGHVRIGFNEADHEEGPRLIAVNVDGVDIVNTYVPQGESPDTDKFVYKLDWLDRLYGYFETYYSPNDPLIWVGDFNVAPAPMDVYDPEKLLGHVGFHPKEHDVLSKLKAWGFVDVYRKCNPFVVAEF